MSAYQIRPIQTHDNAQVAHIIRTVMTEFGACGPGYSIVDPEVNDMFSAYNNEHSVYYVIVVKNEVVGCGGIAPLIGGPKGTCELKKMYFLTSLRGFGAGKELMELCLNSAKKLGFSQCYLETLQHMTAARALYEKFGFKPLDRHMGATGHTGCNCWYIREL